MKVFNDREIIKVLKANSFVLVRTKGDHSIYCHSDGRTITINKHTNRMVWQRLVKTNKLICKF